MVNKTISIEHISTKHQLGDLFTKPLPKPQFCKLRHHYGLVITMHLITRECENIIYFEYGNILFIFVHMIFYTILLIFMHIHEKIPLMGICIFSMRIVRRMSIFGTHYSTICVPYDNLYLLCATYIAHNNGSFCHGSRYFCLEQK